MEVISEVLKQARCKPFACYSISNVLCYCLVFKLYLLVKWVDTLRPSCNTLTKVACRQLAVQKSELNLACTIFSQLPRLAMKRRIYTVVSTLSSPVKGVSRAGLY